MTLEQQIIHEWKTNPSIRAEFNNNLPAYSAYREAEAAGLVRIIGG